MYQMSTKMVPKRDENRRKNAEENPSEALKYNGFGGFGTDGII